MRQRVKMKSEDSVRFLYHLADRIDRAKREGSPSELWTTISAAHQAMMRCGDTSCVYQENLKIRTYLSMMNEAHDSFNLNDDSYYNDLKEELTLAAIDNDAARVEILLEAGARAADVNLADVFARSLDNSGLGVIERLVRAGAKPLESVLRLVLTIRDRSTESLLVAMVESGADWKIVARGLSIKLHGRSKDEDRAEVIRTLVARKVKREMEEDERSKR